MSMTLVALVLTAVDGSPAEARDVYARRSARVELFAAVEKRRGDRCWIYTDAPRVRSNCKHVRLPPSAVVDWFKVEAQAAAYDNVPGGKFSFAEISWVESPWTQGASSVRADVRPVIRAGVGGGGTMRFGVEVKWPGGRRLTTRKLEPRPGGPTRRRDARKVTLRPDDTYLGYMTELAGLPYIFGSAAQGREPHQAERRVGVDCADLMVYGLRRLGHDVGYRSSRTLGPISRPVSAKVTAIRAGTYLVGAKPIPVGAVGVRPGDWLIFDGHVGAFVEDRGQLGTLDEEDILMHIAWRELAVESLKSSGYGSTPFEIRRPMALAQAGSN